MATPPWTEVGRTGKHVTTFLMTNLAPGTTYCFRVKAQGPPAGVNASGGYGPYSAQVCAANKAPAPAPPGPAPTNTPSSSGSPTAMPLLMPADLTFLGGFRVPNYNDAVDTLSLNSYVKLAYNPSRNSLFITGQSAALIELSIPQLVVTGTFNVAASGNLGDMNTASLVAPNNTFTNVLSSIPFPLSGATDGQGIGGMLVYNGKLICTNYAYYSGAVTQTTSHFVIDSLTLASANVTGLYAINGDGRVPAGQIWSVPPEWQAAVGFPLLSGSCSLTNIAYSSNGPSAFGFDPAAFSYAQGCPSTTFLYYPNGNELGPFGTSGTVVDPLYSGTSNGVNSCGIVWVPGTSTIIVFGGGGSSYTGYGPPGNEGPWDLNAVYTQRAFFYDAHDLLNAANPWGPVPYYTWDFRFPIDCYNQGGNGIGTLCPLVGGAAYDSANGIIYLSANSADNPFTSPLPVIYAFKVNVPPARRSGPPTVGSLAAYPHNKTGYNYTGTGGDGWTGPNGDGDARMPGSTVIDLVAGNCYPVTPGATISQVNFYLDGTDAAHLLGAGTPDNTIPNAQHNYFMFSLPTSGQTAGAHTYYAIATDSNGQTSAATAYPQTYT